MKKPPKASKAIATYFTAKRMEDAGLLRPGTALLLASSPTKTVKRFPERMVNRMKTTRGGGQGGAPPLVVVSDWILATGAWNDAGVWDDAAMWKDAA